MWKLSGYFLAAGFQGEFGFPGLEAIPSFLLLASPFSHLDCGLEAGSGIGQFVTMKQTEW